MTLYPSIRYRDPRAALTWLHEAFGFTEKAVHEGPDGTIVHAEMDGAGGVIMLGSDGGRSDERFGSHAGQAWTYASIVRDPEGNLWSFGTYGP